MEENEYIFTLTPTHILGNYCVPIFACGKDQAKRIFEKNFPHISYLCYTEAEFEKEKKDTRHMKHLSRIDTPKMYKCSLFKPVTAEGVPC